MNRQVYGLYAKDEPLQLRYIGVTIQELPNRLRGHQNENLRRLNGKEYRRKDFRKSEWIQAVKERGSEIGIILLSTHDNDEDLFRAEKQWIDFWSHYVVLLNIDRIRWSAGKRKIRAI